jgi:hypothetical protein
LGGVSGSGEEEEEGEEHGETEGRHEHRILETQQWWRRKW